MKAIGIVGSGNVAFHLSLALKRAGLDISWVYGRNEIEVKELASMLGTIGTTSLPTYEPDVVLICVSDEAIQTIIDQVPADWNVAYTSGALGLHQLKFKQQNCGVFYPLQTFSKTRSLNFSEIPILIEGTNFQFADELFSLGQKVSRHVKFISSEERKSIHLAAVFCNNFVNHLLFQSSTIMVEKELDFQLLLPLIEETIKKAVALGPKAAQTGPARRDDSTTINQHLSMLDGLPKEIYEIITQSIITTYKNG